MKGSVKLEDGCELFYEDYGEGDAVLFIPGLTCTTEFFEHNLQALADDRRILSYDPRSRGKSASPNTVTILFNAERILPIS